MKWKLKKENDEYSIKVKINDEEKSFSYIEMIKELYENKKLEDAEYDGDFSDTEKLMKILAKKYLRTPILIHSISPSLQLAIKSKCSIHKWIINCKVINKPL